MHSARTLVRRGRVTQLTGPSSYICRQCRTIQISSSPTTESPRLGGDAFGAPLDTSKNVAGKRRPAGLMARDADEGFLDAKFEVLGTPYSLLSVSLSASQRLYTRRGTLVAVSGKAQNVRMPLMVAESNHDVLTRFRTGPIDPVAPVTTQSRSDRRTFSIPTNLVNNAGSGINIDQVAHDHLLRITSRRHDRLGCGSAISSARMDGSLAYGDSPCAVPLAAGTLGFFRADRARSSCLVGTRSYPPVDTG